MLKYGQVHDLQGTVVCRTVAFLVDAVWMFPEGWQNSHYAHLLHNPVPQPPVLFVIPCSAPAWTQWVYCGFSFLQQKWRQPILKKDSFL